MALRRLIVFPGALGDFLLLAPAIAGLRARGDAVELSVRRALADVALAIAPGAAGPPVDGVAIASFFGTELHPDVAGWLRGAARVDSWLTGTEALERDALVLGIGKVRPHHVERGDTGPHVAEVYATALHVVPAPPSVSPAWLGAVAERRRGLVIHPGAGAPAKRWSRTGFIAVADAWRADGGDVTVLLGPAEEGEESAWRATGHDVVVGLDLRAAAAVVASASWYLGNDSGMSHLAGLLARRGAVLFGPTSAARWRPRGGALVPVAFRDTLEADVVARVVAALRSVGAALS